MLCLITLWLYLSQIKPLEMGIHPQETTIQSLGKTLLIISFVLFLETELVPTRGPK